MNIFINKDKKKFHILSIDLAGSEKRETGIAYFDSYDKIKCKTLYFNHEIIEEAQKFKYVFIDAPLSLPNGRYSLEVNNNIHFRECDIELKKRKIKFFPITLGSMRLLTKRGIYINNVLKSKGIKCYEIFPGSSYDIFGIKRKNLNEQKRFYNKFGLKVNPKNQHESDAVIGLITALLFINGKAEVLKGKDGSIIIPRKLW
jgi:predicted nuclease with RNAse H fold